MQAIILAAGMGKRLKELTKDKTKCLVKVNGVALIERYVTFSKEEILNYVERIVAGDDEKKKGREILVSKAKKEHLGATERIVEAIRVDYYKKF